ncbi:MAG: hypothetical protein ABIB71_03365 [Candidatus Woesearchaeota archaeon]
MRKLIFLVLALIFLSSCSYDKDYSLDPFYVLDAAGVDSPTYISSLKDIDAEDEWAKGDIYLMLARLEDKSYYEKACDSFKSYDPETKEEEALLYETLGSLGCGKDHYGKASKIWEELGVGWRSSLLRSLPEPVLEFETSEIEPALDLSGSPYIIIGGSNVTIEENARIATQDDRVLRDWLGLQMQNPFNSPILKTFSERLTYNEEDLREDIGWHEGGRLLDIIGNIEVSHIPVTGTIVAKHEGKWYAPDENGIFRFEVPLDKVSYPTTRFFSENIAMIIDTHGMNMVVEQAVRNEADVVIACCDHPGKAKAALYLSQHNISALCFPDLYVHKLLGLNSKTLGSPPMKVKDGKFVFGGRPLEIKKNEKIVLPNPATDKYALWYYQSPLLYFNEIRKTFPLDIHAVAINDFGEAHKLYAKAREVKTKTVATRVFSKNDYEEAKLWLMESTKNRIILFHSTAYPYGVLLSQEFEGQTSFADPNIMALA